MQMPSTLKTKYIGYISFLVILTLLSSTWCLAASQDSITNSNFANAGIDVERSGQNLDVIIDQDKALSNGLQLFQTTGAIPAGKFTQKDIIDKPVTISSSVIGLMFVLGILNNIYTKFSDADELHINAFILSPDEYGNNKKQLCYSFDFNRSIYKKINWDNFDISNFLTIAPNFAYSNWCIKKFGEESAISKFN